MHIFLYFLLIFILFFARLKHRGEYMKSCIYCGSKIGDNGCMQCGYIAEQMVTLDTQKIPVTMAVVNDVFFATNSTHAEIIGKMYFGNIYCLRADEGDILFKKPGWKTTKLSIRAGQTYSVYLKKTLLSRKIIAEESV